MKRQYVRTSQRLNFDAAKRPNVQTSKRFNVKSPDPPFVLTCLQQATSPAATERAPKHREATGGSRRLGTAKDFDVLTFRRFDVSTRGFTLIEVLVSVALILALSAVIFTFLRDVTTSRDRVREFTAQQRIANTLIERIEQQAVFAIVGDRAFGSGLTGDNVSLTILSRGVAVREIAEADSWHRAFLDLVRTEYRFDPATHHVQVSQTVPTMSEHDADGADGIGDFRTSGFAELHSAGSRANDGAGFESFDTRLYKVRFRFHDGLAWRDSFDSRTAGRLPLAIEIAIWFTPWPGSEWTDEEPDRFEMFDDDELERLTFDMDGRFDEEAFAMREDRDFGPDPPPDRIRIIAIPDADEDAFDAVVDEEMG
jgi:prepilin-type N-terminal cleavage/methylation domain-containing protein